MRRSSNYVWVTEPMKKQVKGLLAYWREKRPIFALVGTAGSFAATILFALYNGGLGLWHKSLWHGSICIYYILLSLLRGILLATERRAGSEQPDVAEDYRKKAFYVTSGFVLVMNAALPVPAALMVLNRRFVQTGLIPAIASAAYTTYKISAAAVKWKQTGGTILERELRMIRLVDALVSVLVLQNTMIIAVDSGISQGMFRLAAVSSAGILLLIFTVSAAWFVQGRSFRRN